MHIQLVAPNLYRLYIPSIQFVSWFPSHTEAVIYWLSLGAIE